jgi:hypothetical protein
MLASFCTADAMSAKEETPIGYALGQIYQKVKDYFDPSRFFLESSPHI